jgi:hypothetical protein
MRFLHDSVKRIFGQTEAMKFDASDARSSVPAQAFVSLGIPRERMYLVDNDESLNHMIEVLDNELFKPMELLKNHSPIANTSNGSIREYNVTAGTDTLEVGDMTMSVDSADSSPSTDKKSKKGKKSKKIAETVPEIPEEAGARRLFSVIGIDCEWRPEYYYGRAKKLKAKEHYAVSDMADDLATEGISGTIRLSILKIFCAVCLIETGK